MFDVNEIMKEFQEAIKIKDNPNTLSLDILIKNAKKTTEGSAEGPLSQLKDKEGLKELMKMAGKEEEVAEFEAEQIKGGIRLKFKNAKDKASMKDLFEQVFHGDLLRTVFEQFLGIFNEIGKAFESMGEKLGDQSDPKE